METKCFKYKENRRTRNKKKREKIRELILYSNHHFCEYYDDSDSKYEHWCHWGSGCKVRISQQKLKSMNERRKKRKIKKLDNIIRNVLYRKITIYMINIIVQAIKK